MSGSPVEALVDLQNGEAARANDTIAPKYPCPQSAAKQAPWGARDEEMNGTETRVTMAESLE